MPKERVEEKFDVHGMVEDLKRNFDYLRSEFAVFDRDMDAELLPIAAALDYSEVPVFIEILKGLDHPRVLGYQPFNSKMAAALKILERNRRPVEVAAKNAIEVVQSDVAEELREKAKLIHLANEIQSHWVSLLQLNKKIKEIDHCGLDIQRANEYIEINKPFLLNFIEFFSSIPEDFVAVNGNARIRGNPKEVALSLTQRLSANSYKVTGIADNVVLWQEVSLVLGLLEDFVNKTAV